MSPAIKFDVTGVEAGGDRELPKAGVYACKLTEATRRTGDHDDLAVVYEITAPKEHKGFPLYDYVPFSEAARFRLRQFLEAFGLVTEKKEKGQFDPTKLIGKECQVRIKRRSSEEFGEQVKVASVLPAKDDDDGEDLDDGDNDDDAEDYEEYDDDELKEELKERSLKLSGRFSRKKAIAALEESDGEDLDDDDNDDDDDDDAGDEPDFDEMSASDLKEFFEENFEDEDFDEIVGKGSAKTRVKRLRDWLAENYESDEDDDKSEDDYDEWEPDDLKSELKERGLQVSGRFSKAKAIAALREDDDEDDPFDD